jgi:hypothetical protein
MYAKIARTPNPANFTILLISLVRRDNNIGMYKIKERY